MAAPAWVFLGEVKAVNGGSAVKETGKNGWLESSDGWSTHSKTWDDLCADPGITSTDKPSYAFPYHSTIWPAGKDWVGLLSEDGFKNTGLNNGENHLKCWYNGELAGLPGPGKFPGTEMYTKTWTPDFSDKDGQSIQGWYATGTAQIIRLSKNSGKRVPYTTNWNECPLP